MQLRGPFWLKGGRTAAHSPDTVLEKYSDLTRAHSLFVPASRSIYLGAFSVSLASHSTMEHLPANLEFNERLFQNISLHTGNPSQRLSQPDWQDFTLTGIPELGATFDYHVGNAIPLFPPLPLSSSHYIPTVAPLVEGFDSSRIIRPLERIGDYLLPDFGIPPHSGVVEFNFGEVQTAWRDRAGPRPSFGASSSGNFSPLHILSSSDRLNPGNLTASSSTTHSPFGIPPPIGLLPAGYAPVSHLQTPSYSRDDSPFLLDGHLSVDLLNPRLLAALSNDTHPFPDTFSSLDNLPPNDPLELHLPMTSSPNTRPLINAPSSSSSDTPLLGSSCSGDPLEFFPSASSSSAHHLSDIFPDIPSSNNLTPLDTPLDIPFSGDFFEFHPLTISSSGNDSPPPLGVTSFHDLLDLQPCDTLPTWSNTSTSTPTTDSPGPTCSRGSPSNHTATPVSTMPADLQDVDRENPNSVLLFLKECDERKYECLWSHGGDRVCGYTARFTQARRHVTRVHFELKCVSEFHIISAADTKSLAGNMDARTVQSDFTANMTLAFTRTFSE